MNRINERREFFRVTLDEILAATELPPADIEVTRIAEARDYRKTLALLEDESLRGIWTNSNSPSAPPSRISSLVQPDAVGLPAHG